MTRDIAILGATGSIGTQALDIVRQYPERFSIAMLSANTNAEGLFKLAREFRPRVCALSSEPGAIPGDLKRIDWYIGPNANERALKACGARDALCAVVGIAGLGAVLTALDVCERVLLANKEALVTGGKLVMDKAANNKRELLPVDSEHSAIYQCLRAANGNAPARLILTCSGGALRDFPKEALYNASACDVLKHPTWRMGEKITVDCATLMNKGLEVIEAHHLFGVKPENIEVVIHPQSAIHSMVEFSDGAVLAQLAAPDMRGPIGYAMGYPDRLNYGGERLDFAKMGRLDFSAPDVARFPCLAYAYEALRAGLSAPVTLNGANEVAVAAFLAGVIKFGQIADIVRYALDNAEPLEISCDKAVYEADARARELANRALQKYAGARDIGGII